MHDSGVGVVVSCRDNDPVFPIERVQEVLKNVHIDEFIAMSGGHDELTYNPSESVAVIDEVFDELALKKQEAVVD